MGYENTNNIQHSPIHNNTISYGMGIITNKMEKIIMYTQSGVEYWILDPKNKGASVDIVDGDIATIEALHDLLLDKHGYHLDFVTLKRARELTAKMYAKIYTKQTERRK